jgi:hypothetical protein
MSTFYCLPPKATADLPAELMTVKHGNDTFRKRGAHRVDAPSDPRPARRHQHDHADLPTRQVLLVAKVLVGGDKGVETFGPGARERISIFESAPPSIVGRLDGMML